MIRNRKALEAFERDLIRNSRVDIERNFRIIDALYEEALYLKSFLRNHPLDGLDNVLHIAKVVNSVPGTPH
jgi:hypothetical protein